MGKKVNCLKRYLVLVNLQVFSIAIVYNLLKFTGVNGEALGGATGAFIVAMCWFTCECKFSKID